MIIDSRTVEADREIETDLCIVGAGVAGITLALELIDQPFKVCLVESGGIRPDNATQALFWGENHGLPYYPLDTARACGFGGSGHRWNIDLLDGDFGVRLHPLDSLDFEERDWVPNSGWPFKKSHLDPFYERAQAVCKVGSYRYDPEAWENLESRPPLTFVNGRVKTTIFQFADRSTFVEDYRNEIARADNIMTLSHASVTRLEADEVGRTVSRMRARCLGGNAFWIRAKNVVLALGAIETPRLLLISNQVHRCGLGNGSDLVGRYFMEHPHLWSGRFLPAHEGVARRTGLYRLHRSENTNIPVMGKLTIPEDVQRSERILNYCVSIHPVLHRSRSDVAPHWPVVSWPLLKASDNDVKPETDAGLRSLVRELRSVMSRAYRTIKKPGVFFTLNHMSEQLPNPDSRVMLSNEKDLFGRNRAQLHWRVQPLDIFTIRRAQEIISEEMQRSGLGCLEIQMKGETPPPDLHGGWHHMGTTRMHVNASRGVVDENCRIHGMSNVFIAGPSVFPTGGYANPVLTVVALTIRLADHIKKMM